MTVVRRIISGIVGRMKEEARRNTFGLYLVGQRLPNCHGQIVFVYVSGRKERWVSGVFGRGIQARVGCVSQQQESDWHERREPPTRNGQSLRRVWRLMWPNKTMGGGRIEKTKKVTRQLEPWMTTKEDTAGATLERDLQPPKEFCLKAFGRPSPPDLSLTPLASLR